MIFPADSGNPQIISSWTQSVDFLNLRENKITVPIEEFKLTMIE